MFLLPLITILLGVEFVMVFDRVTSSYEERLRDSYTILVVTKEPITLEELRALEPSISSIEKIPREKIAKEIASGMPSTTSKMILNLLPSFYKLHLNRYMSKMEVEAIRLSLLRSKKIKRIETFGEDHRAKYNLFIFLKIIFWGFAIITSLISILLIIKQMEVWQLAHRERMQIMEVFGAPMLLRSGVLFRMGITDAIIATAISAGLFNFIKYYWAVKSGIEILSERRELLFEAKDLITLGGIAITIVIVAVLTVAFKTRESYE